MVNKNDDLYVVVKTFGNDDGSILIELLLYFRQVVFPIRKAGLVSIFRRRLTVRFREIPNIAGRVGKADAFCDLRNGHRRFV